MAMKDVLRNEPKGPGADRRLCGAEPRATDASRVLHITSIGLVTSLGRHRFEQMSTCPITIRGTVRWNTAKPRIDHLGDRAANKCYSITFLVVALCWIV